MKSIISIIYLTFISNILFAQVDIPIGTWRIHTPGRICKTIEKVGNKVYAASESSFIVYNQDDNSVKSLSKIDGFNGSGISVLKYHQSTSNLIIGYLDGNVDLLNEDGTITNLNDIKRANIVGSKQINHISFRGNLAYLSCAFGIVVIDLNKIEVKETYSNIGFNGSQIEVYSSAFKGDSIFTATSQGIKVGNTLSNYNLIDFNNWYTYSATDGVVSSAKFKSIGVLGNTVFASNVNSEIYKANSNVWEMDSSYIFPNPDVVVLENYQNHLQFIHPNKIITIDISYNKSYSDTLNNIYDAVYESDNLSWLASSEKGIVKYEIGNTINISPNSPYYKSAFRFKNYTDWDGVENLLVTTGGFDNSANPKKLPYGMYIFRKGVWENYNSNLGNLPASQTYIEADYNPLDSSVYLASFDGIVKFKRNSSDSSQSKILTTNETGVTPVCCDTYFFMFDIKFDKNNRAWALGPQRFTTTTPTLFSFKNGINKGYDFSFINNTSRYPVELLIDDYNNKWIRFSINNGGGIVVFNENATGTQKKYLTNQLGEGKLPAMGVNCMNKDKNGQIWIGTEKGVVYFSDPNSVLTSTNYDASIPVFENRALLHDKSVKCITTDGANRKWIGTTDGVWLFNEDGSQLILNFTVDNSPLPSNNIYDIELNKSTGEVFFATDAGIVSYRGTATEPLAVNTSEESIYEAKVFPNPVTPDFHGSIGITGLPANTNIKITDINGVLMYETTSNGGTATWNGLTYSGSKVNSGIYLVFATNKEGMQTMVTKFAVVK